MYDILGNLILKQQPELTTNEVKINISHLSEGVYFMKIHQGTQIYQHKFIIRR